jgi:hypothetical protein
MRAAAPRLASTSPGNENVELVCSSGHRTAHSLARVLRLNDGWCGRCGADISYAPLADAGHVPLLGDSLKADPPARAVSTAA